MLSGRRYDAQAGLNLGLAHYVVPPGDGFATAMKIANDVAQNSQASNFSVINAIPRICDSRSTTGCLRNPTSCP